MGLSDQNFHIYLQHTLYFDLLYPPKTPSSTDLAYRESDSLMSKYVSCEQFK